MSQHAAWTIEWAIRISRFLRLCGRMIESQEVDVNGRIAISGRHLIEGDLHHTSIGLQSSNERRALTTVLIWSCTVDVPKNGLGIQTSAVPVSGHPTTEIHNSLRSCITVADVIRRRLAQRLSQRHQDKAETQQSYSSHDKLSSKKTLTLL